MAGLALVWMAAAPCPGWGQSAVWQPQGATTGNIYYNGGSVGIGTPSPSAPLDLTSTSYTVARFASTGSLNDTEVHINSNGPAVGYAQMAFDDRGSPLWSVYKDNANQFNISHFGMTPALTVPSAGNALYLMPYGGAVGIGTTNPQYLLSVNGTMGAKDVIVTNTGWSDYVFQPGYRLQPLTEVGAYIQANHHLPDIPSEAEVRDKGVSVGDMQSKLLAKVEELTLHLIQQEKDNQDLRERIARLEKSATAGSTLTTAK